MLNRGYRSRFTENEMALSQFTKNTYNICTVVSPFCIDNFQEGGVQVPENTILLPMTQTEVFLLSERKHEV